MHEVYKLNGVVWGVVCWPSYLVGKLVPMILHSDQQVGVNAVDEMVAIVTDRKDFTLERVSLDLEH
jgi:hypothetical protein